VGSCTLHCVNEQRPSGLVALFLMCSDLLQRSYLFEILGSQTSVALKKVDSALTPCEQWKYLLILQTVTVFFNSSMTVQTFLVILMRRDASSGDKTIRR
jgi:hypothetical protein